MRRLRQHVFSKPRTGFSITLHSLNTAKHAREKLHWRRCGCRTRPSCDHWNKPAQCFVRHSRRGAVAAKSKCAMNLSRKGVERHRLDTTHVLDLLGILHYVVNHDQYLQFVIVVTLVLANLDVAFTCMSSSDFEQANSQGTSS